MEKSLFDRMYAAGKEILDAARKPLERKALKREFEKQHDHHADIKLKKEQELANMLSDIKTYDMSKYIKAKEEIKDAEYAMGVIAEHYKEMFDEDFPQ